MTIESLRKLDEHEPQDLEVILTHLSKQELLAYFAFVAAKPFEGDRRERDDAKFKLCRIELERRIIHDTNNNI